MSNGKGSKPRPLSIPRAEFEDNWDRIFGRKDTSVPSVQTNTDTQTQPKKKERKHHG